MDEARRVVTGEAVLTGTTTDLGNIDRSEAASCHVECTRQDIESLVREHSRMVYRVAYAVLRGHHDAEDATQETFLRVLRYSSKLDGIEDKKTWLARIAWRVAVDRTKKRGRAREIPLNDPAKPIAEPASTAASADETIQNIHMGTRLERLISALPKKLRQPLILSTIEEMSPREVAATLGISEATVRSRAFRARQILKEKLMPHANR